MSTFSIGERVKHHKFNGTIVEIDDISARVFVEEQGNTRWVELDELTSIDALRAERDALAAEVARLRGEQPTVDDIPTRYKKELADDVDTFLKLKPDILRFNLEWIQMNIGRSPIAVGIVLGDLQLLIEELLNNS